MNDTEVYQGPSALDGVIERLGGDLATLMEDRGMADPLMVGIHTGGVWLAERLHARLGLKDPLGRLDISFYRDDFTRTGMHPEVKPSHLPVPVEDRHIVLVDDVLQTGRTIRAALNVLFDYGRPASVVLAVLVERDGRELPIQPDLVGLHTKLEPGQPIKLTGPDPLTLVLGQPPKQRRNKDA